MSRTALIRLLLVAGIVASGGTAFALVGLANLEDNLVAAEPAFDAGAIRSGVTVERRYVLSNRSLKHVKITSVTPACQCDTEAKVSATEVAWLGQAEVFVRWRAPAKVGPASTGVTIAYTLGDQPRVLQLELTAEVMSP